MSTCRDKERTHTHTHTSLDTCIGLLPKSNFLSTEPFPIQVKGLCECLMPRASERKVCPFNNLLPGHPRHYQLFQCILFPC